MKVVMQSCYVMPLCTDLPAESPVASGSIGPAALFVFVVSAVLSGSINEGVYAAQRKNAVVCCA
jgi:hypothetical protein